MTTASIAGGIAGGVIGFFIGGPLGAGIGVGIGVGLGMIVNPQQPDAQTPGKPQDLSVNTATEGTPVQDGLGTVPIVGNIFWSYGNRNEEIVEEVEGGKGGGSQEVTAGFRYYLSWSIGICRGPIDKLYTVYANDKVVYDGDLDPPISGGMVTISLAGMGQADFYFGTEDQVTNTYMSDRIENSDHQPAYNGFCYVVMKDCSIGNYNRAPNMKFVIRKVPTISALTDDRRLVETFDYNPMHALYYVLNVMTGINSAYLDADDFDSNALVLLGEARGLSISFKTAQEALTYIQSILNHVYAGLRWESDSKLHPFLYRKADDESAIGEFSVGEFLDEPQLDRKAWLDTVNDYRVQYSRRIFREVLCPTGCDNFELSQANDGITNSDTIFFTVENPDWNKLGCSDVSFLKDGLSGDAKGIFSNLTSQGNGKFQIQYDASANLCDDYNEDAEGPCPVICGIKIICCKCSNPVPMSFNDGLTSDTIGPNDSIVLYITGGQGNLSWSLSTIDPYNLDVIGSGFSLSAATTTGKTNTLNTSSGCGSVIVTVTDSCNQQVEFVIRCTTGTWDQIESFGACGCTICHTQEEIGGLYREVWRCCTNIFCPCYVNYTGNGGWSRACDVDCPGGCNGSFYSYNVYRWKCS